MTVHTPALGRWLVALTPLLFGAPVAAGQVSPPTGPPEIVTGGSGSVVLPPDRAMVRIGVATRAASASAASAPNGPAVARVQDTLRTFGAPGRAAKVTSFGVVPNYDYQNARRIIDYEARTTLEVTLQDIASLGRLIDAVLAAGATDINSITFESDSANAARGRALTTALGAARQDAEALARAAGGRLGPLRLVTTFLEPSVSYRYAEPPGTPALGAIAAFRRDVVVAVSVQARWVFLPTP